MPLAACGSSRCESRVSKRQVLIQWLGCQRGTMLRWVTLSGAALIKIMGHTVSCSVWGVKARPGVWVCAGKLHCEAGHGVHRLLTEVRMRTFTVTKLQIHLILALNWCYSVVFFDKSSTLHLSTDNTRRIPLYFTLLSRTRQSAAREDRGIPKISLH